MKTFNIKSVIKSILLPAVFLSCSFPLMAQFQVNLQPDSVFHYTKDQYMWFADQTNFYGFQGNLYLIVEYLHSNSGSPESTFSPSVWKVDHKGNVSTYNMKPNNKNYFQYGFPDENDWWQGVQGNSFAFEYNGQLWHYHNEMAKSTATNKSSDSYDCFAHFPQADSLPYHAYYDHIKGSLTIMKKGVFQYDSTLYFLGLYVKSSDPNYKKWCLQKYTYDQVNDKFIHQTDTVINGITGDMLNGTLVHIDTTGVRKLVISTLSTSLGQTYLSYLVPVQQSGKTVFQYQAVPQMPQGLTMCKASTMVPGSTKGSRTPSQMSSQANSERFVVFGYGNNGCSVINYCEYAFSYDLLFIMNMGSVVIPSSMPPHTRNDVYDLVSGVELNPNKFNNTVGSQANGYVQQDWIYYPDKNGYPCGLRFQSDSWKFIPDSTIMSDDLGNDAVTDSTYGPAIRSLWTLAGITDGAPPCTINWNKWDSCYYTDYRPTETTLEIVGEYKSTLTTSTADMYTVGAEITGKNDKSAFQAGAKFSNAFKNTVSGSQTWSNELTMPFILNEETQSLGMYIYVVPTITRYTYKRYPWYDPGFQYPVSGTKQFRFVTSYTAVLYRYLPISGYPFKVNNPNASGLHDWLLANRPMHTDVMNSGIQPVCDPSWTNPGNGQTGTFETMKDTTSSYSHTTSYQAEASYTGKKPKVFEVQVSASTDVDYKTSTESESSLSKKVEVSLHNLESNICGINIPVQYTVSTYRFRKEDRDWWFYDSLGDQRPWYIAYSVGNLQKSLKLLAPVEGDYIKNSGLKFSWEPDGFEPLEYTFFICRSERVSPSQTIFRMSTGSDPAYYLADLSFLDKEKSCYWSVRAVDRDGDITWSPSRSLKTENPDSPGERLSVTPFPNPATPEGFSVLIVTEETGTVFLKITSVNGSLVYNACHEHLQPGAQTIELHRPAIEPGIYILETRINQERVIRKLVIRP